MEKPVSGTSLHFSGTSKDSRSDERGHVIYNVTSDPSVAVTNESRRSDDNCTLGQWVLSLHNLDEVIKIPSINYSN